MKSCVIAAVTFGAAAALVLLAPAVGLPAAAQVYGGPGAPPVTTFPAAGTLTISAVRARTRPNPHAHVVKVMHYFRSDYRRQEMFAVATKVGTDGAWWYHISVPGRPNGRMGWIPAYAADLKPTVAKVVVHRRSRKIDLYWHGKHVWHAKVAVGAPGMETPLGLYYATVRFVPHGDPYLTTYAVETSGYSKLSDWPGGGIFGIHGTPEPWLLGKAVSHGCVRVSAATARKLRRYVPLGTPIYITKT
ncbi:MAG TPA: L,D-transpeptidase [Gaiellaceae bacterium]